MVEPYLIVDIETCPLDIDRYLSLDEERQKELINPIDSKIIALGIRHDGKNKIFLGDNEKEILEKFWSELDAIKKQHPTISIAGFSITNFDLPFITARSFIHGITISPFTIKQTIDLREKINAYRYGPTRGKLKDYASILGLKVLDIEGKDIPHLHKNKNQDEIKEYLLNDLELTDALYKRAIKTNIIKIVKW
ncbi:MAG: 3'-5' exonuclease [Nanoarchaeota archaeon]